MSASSPPASGDGPQQTPERPHAHYDLSTILQPRPPTRPPDPSRAPSPSPPFDAFFDEAFRGRTVSPPHQSFLDNILNPVEPDSYSFSFPPRTSPPLRQPSAMDGRSWDEPPARLTNGYVDLTSAPDSPDTQPALLPRPRRQSPTPGPSAKRRKRQDGSSQDLPAPAPAPVQEVDLSPDTQPVLDVLQKQREDAVKAQQKPEDKATTFNTFTCVICMDTPTDLTATACGHLFCHTCLMEALIAGENRAAPGEPRRSQCPVCRKIINRSKGTDIIPLLLRKGLATQPRKKASTATTLA